MAISEKEKEEALLLIQAMRNNPGLYTGRLYDGLHLLLSIQSVTSRMTPDCIPPAGDPPTPDQIRTYFTALIVEITELLQELNWKPWKQERDVNLKRVADEFADILAFLGIIQVYLSRLGLSSSDLADAYVNKTMVNVSRFNGEVPGYGVK